MERGKSRHRRCGGPHADGASRGWHVRNDAHQPQPHRRGGPAGSRRRQQSGRSDRFHQRVAGSEDLGCDGIRHSGRHDHLRDRGLQSQHHRPHGHSNHRLASDGDGVRGGKFVPDPHLHAQDHQFLFKFFDLRDPIRRDECRGGGLGRRRRRRHGDGQSFHGRRRRGRGLCQECGGGYPGTKLHGCRWIGRGRRRRVHDQRVAGQQQLVQCNQHRLCPGRSPGNGHNRQQQQCRGRRGIFRAVHRRHGLSGRQRLDRHLDFGHHLLFRSGGWRRGQLGKWWPCRCGHGGLRRRMAGRQRRQWRDQQFEWRQWLNLWRRRERRQGERQHGSRRRLRRQRFGSGQL